MHVFRAKIWRITILSALLIESRAGGGSTASTTANAVATIIASISISKTQDLNFGNAAQGDNAKSVPASDTVNAAGFSVTGQASQSYDITLPSTTVSMTTSGGAPVIDRTIDVTTFVSNPSGSGGLDSSGTQSLFVGATRAAIRSTQQAGSYSGSFTVTVTYP